MNIDDIVSYLHRQNIDIDKTVLVNIQRIKEDAIKNGNEQEANFAWCLEVAFEIQELYVKVFQQLKNKEYQSAWSNLENIEIASYAFNSNFITDNVRDEFHIDEILNSARAFQKVFPYRIFGSREAIVRKAHCSICGNIFSLRNGCGHVPGQLYMGQMCTRIIDKMEFVAISIVTNPEDKYSLLMLDGKEFNYSALDFLMEYLEEPYEPWEVEIREILKEEYKRVRRNELCPCGSHLKYKKCCLGTGKEQMDEYHFVFHREKRPRLK